MTYSFCLVLLINFFSYFNLIHFSPSFFVFLPIRLFNLKALIIKLSAALAMQKPTIPKPPAHLPPKNAPQVPATNQPRMDRSKSQQKLSKGKGHSAQKRVRLRDYLFVASTSAMRNNQKKKTLKNSLSQQSLLKESINILKKQKYELPNSEMYLIVKQEIKKDMKSIIQSLRARMEILQADDTVNPSNDDLKYLYNIKRIIGESMQPGIKEIEEMSFKRTGNVLKDFIEKEIIHRNTITQVIKEDDKKPNNLFESFFIYNKN